MGKRPFSQHFLFDDKILNRIIDASEISEKDTIVEIGPGLGSLTKLLLDRAQTVIAIEIDRILYEKLKEKLSRFKNLQLILGDALKFDYKSIGEFKVVSNIPYHITTPLIFKLLEYRTFLKSMTLTTQKEVADRIVAENGSKIYGVLSIMVQYFSAPSIKFIIPKSAFKPSPKVDSAVVFFDILREPYVKVKNENVFFKTVRASFAQRRKTIANNLRSLHRDTLSILKKAGIEPNRRAETLSLKEFAHLSNVMVEYGFERTED